MTMTDSDEQGKLFIGGLSWETTKENLRAYFSQFGEIVDTVVMKNNETGRSRGFGFITYKDPSCVAIVLSARPHQLNGRTVDPKECTPRAMQRGRKSGGDTAAKVFLGGLPPDITESEIRRALSKFGKVTEIIIMYDQEKKKPRGFGFLSFESEDSIDRACAEHFVTINGKQIECKRAEPRENSRKNSAQNFGGNQWNEGGRNQNWRSNQGAPAQGGYQEQWGAQSAPQQSYAAPGNYGNYQNWGAQQPAAPTNYSAYGSVPATQYSQPSYQGYGAAPPAAGGAGYDYSQAAATTAVPTPAYGTQPNPYADGVNYAQPTSGYGTTASYGGYAGKSQGYGATEGATGYGAQGDSQSSTRGQGYHPYRR